MLHKTSELRGYHILATDGGIGHVDDFLIEEREAGRFGIWSSTPATG